MERTFFFGVLPSKYSGSVAGRNADEAKQNYFCGRKRICFASALFKTAGNFVSAAQEGAGGMRGGFAGLEKEKALNLLDIFADKKSSFYSISKITILFNFFLYFSLDYVSYLIPLQRRWCRIKHISY